MKSLRESLLDDDLIDKTDKMIKDEIEAFLKENYDGLIKISRKSNIDGKYEVSSITDIGVKNRNIISLTNEMFIWTKVDGYFNCSHCIRLESLEGAPEKVEGGFYCIGCDNLISLDGAPKKVGEKFNCANCRSLKTLKGAPKVVEKDFDCSDCNSLKSLDGAPKEVGGNFECKSFKIKFIENDIKKVSNVKRKIIC